MSKQGNILSVITLNVGDSFSQDELALTTDIHVDNPYVFDETGGAAYIPDLDQVVVYTGYDVNLSVLHLSNVTPLLASASVGATIEVYPTVVDKRAFVDTGDGFEALDCRVPFAMQAQLPDGIRTSDTGYESVAINNDGSDWTIKEIYGAPPIISGEHIDELPPALLSDGLAPVASPGVTVVPLGVGALFGSWSPAVQPDLHDPVIYDVYVSDTTPVIADSAHFLTSTSGLSAAFSQVNVLGVPTKISTSVPSYMAVWARDSDGLAPTLGGEGSGIPRKADIANLNVGELDAEIISAYDVHASDVTAQKIFANTKIIVGDELASHIVLDPSKGLILYDTSGTNAIVTLDMTATQTSIFTGKIITNQLAVIDSFEMNGTLSKIMPGAKLTIQGSTISPPANAPTLSQATQTAPWSSSPAGFSETGLWWDGTLWWQLLYNSSTFEARVSSISATTSSASAISTVTLADDGTGRDVRGLYVDGTNIWTIRRDSAAAGSGVFKLRKFLRSDGSAVPDTGASPVLSYNSQIGSKSYVYSSLLNDLVVSPTGDIYTLDSKNTVRKFNSSFVYQSQVQVDVVGTAFNQKQLTVDSSGNLYVTSTNNNRVYKLDPSGTLLVTIGSPGSGNGQLTSPTDVKLDSLGNIFVVDSGNDRVQKFDSTGTYLLQFGTTGSGNGQFDEPQRLALDSSNNVYVTDFQNSRVQKFNSSGVYQSQFGSSGSGNGQFNGPDDLWVDASNSVFVMDSNSSRIEEFNSSGVWVASYGSSGGGNGQFLGPKAITGDSSGNVLVADQDITGTARVQKFDTSNTFVSSVTPNGGSTSGLAGPAGAAVDSSGNLYVTDIANYRVMVFNSSGIYQSQFGTKGTGNGQFTEPTGIAFDSTGNIFVVDAGSNRVQKFNSSGVYQSQFGSNGSGNGQFSRPVSIAIDSSDNMYVTDYYNSRVQKFNSSGVYQLKFGTLGTGNGQFDSPTGIDVDSSGNVYVIDYQLVAGLERVQKFTSSGTYVSKFGTQGTGNGQFGYEPKSLFIDNTNNIYVVDTANSRVQKFNSSGTYQSQFGTMGSGSNQFNTPYSIAISSAGDAYVTDYSNSRIQKYTGVFPNLAVQVANEVSSTVRSQPTLGYDGTSLLVGGVDKTNMALANTTLAGVVYYNKNTLVYTGTKATLASGDIIGSSTTYYVGVGSFDYGGTRLVIAGGATVKVYTISGGVLTLDTTYPNWLWDGSVTAGVWDGTNFYSASNSTVLRRYSRFLGASAAQRKFWSQYDWSVGSNHLIPGPMASFDLADRRYLNVAVPAPGTGTTSTRIFTGNGSPAPSNANMWLRSTVTVAGTTQYDTIDTTTSNPVTVSAPISGGPGQIVSQNGGLLMDGDGKLEFDSRILPTLANGTGTTENVIAKWTVPADYFTTGQLAEAFVMGQVGGTSVVTYRVRMGANGTSADPLLIAFSTTPTSPTANRHFTVNAYISSITGGPSGTFTASGFASDGIDLGDGVGPVDGVITLAAVNTTVPRIISITAQSASSQTITSRSAMLTKHRG